MNECITTKHESYAHPLAQTGPGLFLDSTQGCVASLKLSSAMLKERKLELSLARGSTDKNNSNRHNTSETWCFHGSDRKLGPKARQHCFAFRPLSVHTFVQEVSDVEHLLQHCSKPVALHRLLAGLWATQTQKGGCQRSIQHGGQTPEKCHPRQDSTMHVCGGNARCYYYHARTMSWPNLATNQHKAPIPSRAGASAPGREKGCCVNITKSPKNHPWATTQPPSVPEFQEHSSRHQTKQNTREEQPKHFVDLPITRPPDVPSSAFPPSIPRPPPRTPRTASRTAPPKPWRLAGGCP